MLFYDQYSLVFIYFISSFGLALILLLISSTVSISNPDSEKMSSYECGFDPYEDARNSFDVRFYVIAILFIVFDLETSFFLPWCLSFSFLSASSFWGMLDFLFELLLGFLYAWLVGALNWE